MLLPGSGGALTSIVVWSDRAYHSTAEIIFPLLNCRRRYWTVKGMIWWWRYHFWLLFVNAIIGCQWIFKRRLFLVVNVMIPLWPFKWICLLYYHMDPALYHFNTFDPISDLSNYLTCTIWQQALWELVERWGCPR